MEDVSAPEIAPDRPAGSTVGDRRRAGRVTYTNQQLIEMLRDPASAKTGSFEDGAAEGDDTEMPDDDGLRAARGIVNGLVLSTVCWAFIGITLAFLLRG